MMMRRRRRKKMMMVFGHFFFLVVAIQIERPFVHVQQYCHIQILGHIVLEIDTKPLQLYILLHSMMNPTFCHSTVVGNCKK
jgi:hypothetical protein